MKILDFLRKSHVRNELAGNLSGGQKKLLELGRTLMVDVKIVLLDVLGAEVNHTLLNRLADNIIRLNEEMGKTFFIIREIVGSRLLSNDQFAVKILIWNSRVEIQKESG